MRIVFMGTPDFAAAILKRLIDTGRNVVGVFSQPDKPVGRKQVIMPTATKALAMEHGIPVFQPAKLRDGEALRIMQELKPDLTVVAAYGKILPKDILDVAPLGNVNVHGSLLPKYRGSAPIQWSVINGDKVTGITTMYMAEGMDTGDMIMKFELPIGEDETAGELFDRMAKLGAESIEKTLELFDSGEVKAEPQNEEEATYAPMLKKEMGEIDFGKTAEEIHNLVRGLNPWPTAFTFLDGKTIKVHEAKAAEGLSGTEGELLDEKRFVVGTKNGAVEFITVQPEGKNKMSGADFIRGRRLAKGTAFGK
ncbi:MAG: methionyl-tRNA formyltransferase [Oscillospiraceae bacterium]|nr:methionyl-tRNA formyltransferase [Oscillospiraceae bacterium]MBQ4642801.1 methionyl-tRNA formyltransferase [Oscillospiraceae bacterium]